jgi:hypothetical protein
MINTNVSYSKHYLYDQFVEWSGTDYNLENYFMINSALHGAEMYAKNYFEVIISAKMLTDTTVTRDPYHFEYIPTNLLSIYQNKTVLPTVTYVDKVTKTVENSIGYKLNGNTLDMSNGVTTINYLTGFVAKDYYKFDDIPDGNIQKPILKLVDDTTIPTPLYTTNTSIDIKVFGEPNSSITINEVASGVTLDNNGEGTITLDTKAYPITYRIGLEVGNEISKNTNILLINGEDNSEHIFTVLAHSRATNNNKIDISFYTSKEGTLEIDGVTIGQFTSGVHTVNVDVANELPILSFNDIDVPIFISLSTQSDSYITAVNKDSTIPYIPFDLMIAFFKLTQYLYHSTLYKDENIDRYSAGNSKAVTFGGHNIPKDVISIFNMYRVY